MSAAKARRNAALIAAYRKGGVSQAELAERFGLSRSRVSIILGEHGARDPERNAQLVRERWRRARYAGVSFEGRGRPAVWPDCPPEVEPEYRRLRKAYRYRAAEARRMLEAAL